MPPSSNPRTFFDFTVGDRPLGRVVFELFADVYVPSSSPDHTTPTDVPAFLAPPRSKLFAVHASYVADRSFRALCTGEKGASATSGIPLHYKNSPVHRVIDDFMIQGGDFTKRNGTGGESVYGGVFDDERLEGRGTEVDREGLLVMANRGPNTNGSQYFVTLAPAQHLTGKHVVFGRVINGLNHILTIGKLPTDARDRPLSPVIITHCGELELRRPAAPPAPVVPARARSPVSSRSPSRSRSRSPSPRRQRKYSTSSGSDSEDERARRRREKKERKERKREKKEKKRAKRRAENGEDAPARGGGEDETEAELDARLEREENERMEAERVERERRAEEYKKRTVDIGGVVYKGRGAMRFLDPEAGENRTVPTNYTSRLPSTRPKRGTFTGQAAPNNFGTRSGDPAAVAGAIADRWVKGVDARPVFESASRQRGLDAYKTKGEDNRRAGAFPGGDSDRWDRGREGNGPVDGEDERGRSRSPDARRGEVPLAARISRARSDTPPVRPDSPLRGERDYGSDMEMDD